MSKAHASTGRPGHDETDDTADNGGIAADARLAWARSMACRGVLVVCGLMLAAPPAMAAGFLLYEMGTPDLGTASAGRAALAKDAATVFGNPAGMTKLDGTQLLVGRSSPSAMSISIAARAPPWLAHLRQFGPGRRPESRRFPGLRGSWSSRCSATYWIDCV
jgi:hypothetical protein